MIVDRLDAHNRYFNCLAWNAAFAFLKGLVGNCEDGEYEISGKDVYAIISSYDTKPYHRFEAHRTYVDIQVLLRGEETLAYTELSNCTTDDAYSEEKDIIFYTPKDTSATRVRLTPGMFVVLFPGELHMPGVMAEEISQPVKKVVVKIKADLLK